MNNELNLKKSPSFGYNFNLANFANVGITRTWSVGKNDYDIRYALNNSEKPSEEKDKIRKDKLFLNIFVNLAQYLFINAVMLKFDKQVNKSTLIAVGIPFLINSFIDIFSRTPFGEKMLKKYSRKDESLSEANKFNDIQQFNIAEIIPLDTKYDPALEEYFKNRSDKNISFGSVSYTTVHLLGKLANKLRTSVTQTYDVYSAGKELNLPQDYVKEATTLKFLREMSSQLIENIIYFAVLLKLKKKLDKSLAMAVFIPAALTIAIDLINRSNLFNFLKDWSKKLSKSNNEKTVLNEIKLFDSVKGYKYYLEKKYANCQSGK